MPGETSEVREGAGVTLLITDETGCTNITKALFNDLAELRLDPLDALRQALTAVTREALTAVLDNGMFRQKS